MGQEQVGCWASLDTLGRWASWGCEAAGGSPAQPGQPLLHSWHHTSSPCRTHGTNRHSSPNKSAVQWRWAAAERLVRPAKLGEDGWVWTVMGGQGGGQRRGRSAGSNSEAACPGGLARRPKGWGHRGRSPRGLPGYPPAPHLWPLLQLHEALHLHQPCYPDPDCTILPLQMPFSCNTALPSSELPLPATHL